MNQSVPIFISKILFSLLLIVVFNSTIYSQNFLSTHGKAIVNENQDTILLRGMGLGGWMVQEGYMLQTSGFANPQHEIRETIENLIGEEDTDAFYEAWLNNHVQKSDIDSLKAWGFNSVRLPMHYNLFTLPIEDEPVLGEDTWLDKGFELTDKLISWCKENEMYVILDMHAAPGGQGYDAAISDYDSTKPSLWESEENRRKFVALWTRIAEYYADEEWVAGYDLLNEPNWDLPGGIALRSIYQNLTTSIREVDPRHILFIEGNWFANDFTGLTPPWDDNFVYSPHKYWSTNNEATMQWVIDLRNTYNVPLYIGESGENSNVWFRDAIALLEGLDIGWAWWPMKKVESIAGPLSIIKTPEYQRLLDYWSGNATMPSAEYARDALMDLTEKLKTENCVFQKDVIDAMFRQVYSNDTKPFKKHTIPGVVHATDYDLGVIGSAYYDKQSANYQVSTGEFTTWNDGWQYRNDGVDIERSSNTINGNGYNVGFMDAGEWMQYEVEVLESGVYEAHVRSSSGSSGGMSYMSLDGVDITSNVVQGPTGGWQNWETVVVPNIILEAGVQKLKFHTNEAGYNLASFEFVKTDINVEDISMEFLGAETIDENSIRVMLNKRIDGSLPDVAGDFELYVDGVFVPTETAMLDATNNRVINITVDYVMNYLHDIKLTYLGDLVVAIDGSDLLEFDMEPVRNTLSFVNQIPGRIQAEAFINQEGVEIEATTDTGGGENIGYLDVSDFVEYEVNVTTAGTYNIDYRTAAEFGTGGVQLKLIDAQGDEIIVDNTTFASTGGWQSWTTTSSTAVLPQGRYTMRMTITQAPVNINWMDFDFIVSTSELEIGISEVSLYPNPASDHINFGATLSDKQDVRISVYDMQGRLLTETYLDGVSQVNELLSLENTPSAQYFIKLELENGEVWSGSVLGF